jgi:hypothetical protein
MSQPLLARWSCMQVISTVYLDYTVLHQHSSKRPRCLRAKNSDLRLDIRLGP